MLFFLVDLCTEEFITAHSKVANVNWYRPNSVPLWMSNSRHEFAFWHGFLIRARTNSGRNWCLLLFCFALIVALVAVSVCGWPESARCALLSLNAFVYCSMQILCQFSPANFSIWCARARLLTFLFYVCICRSITSTKRNAERREENEE